MLNLIRFANYALKFEKAYKYNKWDEVKRCFHSDISYVIDGKFPFEGKFKGAQNVIEALQKSVNEFDRNIDLTITNMRNIFLCSLIFCSTISSFSQNWKTYLYNPPGSVLNFPLDDGLFTKKLIKQ